MPLPTRRLPKLHRSQTQGAAEEPILGNVLDRDVTRRPADTLMELREHV